MIRALIVALAWSASIPALEPETLEPAGGLAAHIAASFEELSACQQSATGDYFIFDRRAHAVYRVPPGGAAERKQLVAVGAEPGRVIAPNAFDLAADNTFAIADAPFGVQRVQMFHETGMRLGGFSLGRINAPFVTIQGAVVSGVASIEYTGRSLFINQPDVGALVTEYTFEGATVRTFGELRATGQEHDRDVHIALNTGNIVVNPKGGFYFVFLAGVPVFRKYDAAGKLVFERHVEGVELDGYLAGLPAAWPRKTADGEIPLVLPSVRTAEADPDGNLWISLTVPYTYVYDTAGEKRRTVQFRATGILSPASLSFPRAGRVLVPPGCYLFPTTPARAGASGGY